VAPANAPPAGESADGAVVVVVLAALRPRARLWGWGRIVRGPGALRAVPGLRFAKVLGSGHEGGFGLRPSGSRQGLFLSFDDESAAQRFVDDSPVMRAYRERSSECCVAVLRATACRGRWSGHTLAVGPAKGGSPGPVAALTRASIRPSRALDFWRHAPPSEQALACAPGCRIAVGLGEAPLLRQATFSIWDSVQDMDNYAHGPAHGEAIRAAYSRGYFSESMFARFVPLRLQGTWRGAAYG
jgi:spheroidene monooxygenase